MRDNGAMDLVEFLRARLDDDERAARAATPGPWTADREVAGAVGPLDDCGRPDCARMMVQVLETDDDDAPHPVRETAAHIARHDPVRVLAEVKSKRRIVARHAGDHMCPKPQDDHSWIEAGETVEGLWPCGDLLDLARSYADHPEYDVVWGQGQ